MLITYVFQDLVPESDRCIVGGVQNSLQSMFDLLTYMMGIIISDPKVIDSSFLIVMYIHYGFKSAKIRDP